MRARHIAFLGFALPDSRFLDVLETDRSMPTQTQRFGWNLVRSLHTAGFSGNLISVAPTRDFPHNRRLLIRGGPFSWDTWCGREVAFVNLTGAKHVTRFVGAAIVARRDLAAVDVDCVLVHGVNSALIWAGVRLAKKRGVPCVVVLTDPPSISTPYDNPATRMLKQIDRKVILRGLGAASGVIALTARLAEEFAPGKPMLMMEGIASGRPLTRPKRGREFPTALYAGGLRDGYGVKELVAAAARGRAWRLEIFGKGPLTSFVREASRSHENINFRGLASTDELHDAYAKADLLVNPRPVDESFVAYSFPSKLLEYLASGTPVLSTRLPNIPGDYWPHLIASGDSAEELDEAITNFFEAPVGVRNARGRDAANFILTTRGIQAQGDRIRDFLAELS